MPMGVIQKAVGRHITTHVFAGSPVEILDEIKHLLQGAAIEEIFQLRSAPLGVDRTMRRLPLLTVIAFPFAFKTFLIAVLYPELGFFEVDRLRSSIQRPLNSHAQIPA